MAATTASPCLCGALRKATRAVTRRPLHDKGWIAIRTGRDRRERMLSITAAGRALLAEAEPLWLATQQRMS
ncbi:MAG TPA: hypothetical protein VLM79_26265, partial [Kofleriaceae bacterium]|nr:hypothetical protein [Kofleriaceae bacterium]